MILLLLASLMAFILKKVKDMETFISISHNPCLFSSEADFLEESLCKTSQ